MDKLNDVAGPVIARFPERETSIQRLLKQDREFREMCLDYVAARQALAHWRTLSGGVEGQTVPATYTEPDQVTEQYRILSYELEVEILEALARDAEDADSASV
jgi:hypothetical protein